MSASECSPVLFRGNIEPSLLIRFDEDADLINSRGFRGPRYASSVVIEFIVTSFPAGAVRKSVDMGALWKAAPLTACPVTAVVCLTGSCRSIDTADALRSVAAIVTV